MKGLLVCVLILVQINVFSQEGILNHNNQNEIEEIRNELLETRSELKLTNEVLKNKIKELNSINNSKIDFAGKIIDWSAWLFSLMVIILGIASWIAANRFSKLDKIREELKEVLNQTKTQLNNQIREIENLKKEFKKEKEAAIELLFPVLEAHWFKYQGDYDKSISAYRRAQDIKPEDRLIAHKLNKLLIEQGEFNEAIRNLEGFVEKFPEDIQIHRRLVEGYRRSGQLDSAEIIIKNILDKTDDPAMYYELGNIKLLLKMFSEAEENYKKANRYYYKQEGTYKYWVLTNLALVQDILKKKEDATSNSKKAIDILENRIQITPKNPQIWAYLGLAYLIGGGKDYSKSYQAYKNAILHQLPLSLASSNFERLKLLNSNRKSKTSQKIKSELSDFILKNGG